MKGVKKSGGLGLGLGLGLAKRKLRPQTQTPKKLCFANELFGYVFRSAGLGRSAFLGRSAAVLEAQSFVKQDIVKTEAGDREEEGLVRKRSKAGLRG